MCMSAASQPPVLTVCSSVTSTCCYCIGTDGDTLANRLILCPLQQQQIIRSSGDSYCAISGGEQDSFRRANHKRSQHTGRRTIGLKVWLGSRAGRIDNHPPRHRHHAVAISQHNVNRWWQRNGRRNRRSDDAFRRIMVTSSPQKEHSRKPAQHRHKARLSDSARRKENYGAASGLRCYRFPARIDQRRRRVSRYSIPCSYRSPSTLRLPS
jgi:predicted DNA-binding WGR domain protein